MRVTKRFSFKKKSSPGVKTINSIAFNTEFSHKEQNLNLGRIKLQRVKSCTAKIKRFDYRLLKMVQINIFEMHF